MFDIADKHKLIEEIMSDIRASNSPVSLEFSYENMSGPGIDAFSRVLEDVLESRSRVIVTNIIKHLYTTGEFEKDIGLI